MSKKRFTLRELEDNNVDVSRSDHTVSFPHVVLVLIPVGNDFFELPKGWRFVGHHGYWLLSKGK